MDLDFWDCFGRKKTLSFYGRNTIVLQVFFFFFFFADHLFFQFSGKKLQAQCSLRTLHSVSNCCTDCCHHCGCGVKDSEKYVGESEIIIMTTKVIVAVEKKEFIFQQ